MPVEYVEEEVVDNQGQGISFNDLVNTLLLEYAEKHKI